LTITYFQITIVSYIPFLATLL